jgi:hypothetical protein
MITFEIDSSKEGVEIYLDANGVDELIRYLNFIKNNQDHCHLVVGNELEDKLNQDDNKIVKHVKLIYLGR